MPKVIDWTNFPDVPNGFSQIDIAEVKREYDFELPPLVVYVGVLEDKSGNVIPIVAVVEEGTNNAKIYLLDRETEGRKEEIIASLA